MSCARSFFWSITMIYVYIAFLFSFQGEVILSMTYGHEVKGTHDRKLDVLRQLSEFGNKTLGECSSRPHISVQYAPVSLFAQLIKIMCTIPVRYILAWVPYISLEPLAHIGRTKRLYASRCGS